MMMKDNIMSCLRAKKLGAHRAITLIYRTDYIDLVEGTSIDIAFSPTEATLSDLLRHIRQGDCVIGPYAAQRRRGGDGNCRARLCEKLEGYRAHCR